MSTGRDRIKEFFANQDKHSQGTRLDAPSPVLAYTFVGSVAETVGCLIVTTSSTEKVAHEKCSEFAKFAVDRAVDLLKKTGGRPSWADLQTLVRDLLREALERYSS